MSNDNAAWSCQASLVQMISPIPDVCFTMNFLPFPSLSRPRGVTVVGNLPAQIQLSFLSTHVFKPEPLSPPSDLLRRPHDIQVNWIIIPRHATPNPQFRDCGSGFPPFAMRGFYSSPSIRTRPQPQCKQEKPTLL